MCHWESSASLGLISFAMLQTVIFGFSNCIWIKEYCAWPLAYHLSVTLGTAMNSNRRVRKTHMNYFVSSIFPAFTNLGACHLTPLLICHKVNNFPVLRCWHLIIYNMKLQYKLDKTSFECGFVCSTHTQEVLWDELSRLSLELWVEILN